MRTRAAGAFFIRDAVPADAKAMARVHVDSWRTTYRGILSDGFLGSLTYESREQMWLGGMSRPEHGQSRFILLAVTPEAGVIGFAAGGEARQADLGYPGELYALYLLAEYQRRGIGQALFKACTQRLTAMGRPSMMLWVARENHAARRFYEAVGGELLGVAKQVTRPVTIDEVGYGWRDLRPFAQ